MGDKPSKKELTFELLAVLRKTFPQAFYAKGKEKPLKIGVYADLISRVEIFEKQPDEKILKNTIRSYTGSFSYQVAVGALQSCRIDLDGAVVEPVSDIHRARARALIQKMKNKRAERKAGEQQSREKSAEKNTEAELITEGQDGNKDTGANSHLPKLGLQKKRESKKEEVLT